MRVNVNDAAGGLDAVLSRPVIYLERMGTPNDETQKELATLALVRMARNEPDASGDRAGYRGLRDRYRNMAAQLGFQGHLDAAQRMP